MDDRSPRNNMPRTPRSQAGSRASGEDESRHSDQQPFRAAPDDVLRDEVLVRQEVGTHLRVVKRIAERIATLGAEVILESPLHRANARSILDMLQLGARTGDRVVVHSSGPAAEEAHGFVVALLSAEHWNDDVENG